MFWKFSSVRWLTSVTAKEITSRQKKKTHGKRKNLTAERKRLTANEKTSRQKEKTLRKRKNLTAESEIYLVLQNIFIVFIVTAALASSSKDICRELTLQLTEKKKENVIHLWQTAHINDKCTWMARIFFKRNKFWKLIGFRSFKNG